MIGPLMDNPMQSDSLVLGTVNVSQTNIEKNISRDFEKIDCAAVRNE